MRKAAQAGERERLVKDFMAQVFIRTQARGGAASSLAEDSIRLIQSRFPGQPALQAELFGLVSGGYAEMSAYHLASALLSRQVATLDALDAPRPQRLRARLAWVEALVEE